MSDNSPGNADTTARPADDNALLAAMSHDLRTPLNAIIGFSEVMRDGIFGPLGNPRYVGYATMIHRAGWQLLDMINDVVELSKAASGRIELQEDRIDIRDLVTGSISAARRVLMAAGLIPDVAINAAVSALRGDPGRVKQILTSLLSHACATTPPGGHIIISAEDAADGGVELAVTDSGSGLTEAEIGHILAPAGLSGVVPRHERGEARLPLFLARILAALHGATLAIASQPGIQTRITVRFPAWRSMPTEGDLPEARHASNQPSPTR
ncbi:MAG: HAMP domain-containing sensor histidine kinase [Azospirillaceae bacterium]|nr:HAMP domain-containing sensor histidine kinase [Azospirillaceae bacterium]